MQHEYQKDWQAPKTFEEYLAAYPDWHKKWLAKRYPRHSNEDFSDVAQTLLLRSLEMKRVEKYDTSKRGHKNTPGLFFNYMGMCFGRDLATILQARETENRRVEKLSDSLEDYINSRDNGNGRVASQNEWLALSSHDYAKRTEREGFRAYNRARLAQFRDFALKHRPDLLAAIDRLAAGNDVVNVKNNGELYYKDRTAIRGLVQHFEKRTIPYTSREYGKPKSPRYAAQRRYYQKHKKKINARRRRLYAEKKGRQPVAYDLVDSNDHPGTQQGLLAG